MSLLPTPIPHLTSTPSSSTPSLVNHNCAGLVPSSPFIISASAETNTAIDTFSDRQLMSDLFGENSGDHDETSSSTDESTITDSSIHTFDEVVVDQAEHKNKAVIGYFQPQLEGFQPDVLPHYQHLPPLTLNQITSPSVYWVSEFPTSSANPSSPESQTTESSYDDTSFEEDYMDIDDPHLYQVWGTTTVHSPENVVKTSSRRNVPLQHRIQRKGGQKSQRGSVIRVPSTALSQIKIRKSKGASSPYPIPSKSQRRRRYELSFRHLAIQAQTLACLWPVF